MSDLAPFLQTLRDRLSISEVIRPHVKLVRKGKEFSGLCPFHKEKTPSFTVSDDKGFYHCFGCGAHGDIFEFVMKKQNMPFMEAVELLANLLGLEVPTRSSELNAETVQPKADSSLYVVMEAACSWYQTQLSLTQGAFARNYIEQRGLSAQTISEFRIGYAPDHGLVAALIAQGFSEKLIFEAGLMGRDEDKGTTYDRFRNRLMFPIWDTKGRVIAFGGRILKEGEPKYLNSPDTPIFLKGKTLYAYNIALPVARQNEKPFIVVEGYMDVIALHQVGINTAAAPLGTALTHEQMGLLWRGMGDPILCFDGDAAGMRAAYRAAQKALEVLRVGQTLQFCFLPMGSDPDSMVKEGRLQELQEIFTRPQPLVDVLWAIFMHKRSVSTPEQKAMGRRDLGYLVKEISDPDVRHFYREELNYRYRTMLDAQVKDYSPSDQIQRQGRFLSKNLLKSNSLKTEFPSVSRVSPNKNLLGHKILLATLINHPTLIEDTAESLMLLSDEAGKYDELRQVILSHMAENPPPLAAELQEMLRKQGFASVLEEVLTPQIYAVAPFARETATREEALAGWKEVWQRTIAKRYLIAETTRTASVVRDQFDEETWERFKYLKNQIVSKMDDKKGV